MKRGDLVRAKVFLDLHPTHPKFSDDYSPRDVLRGDLGVIIEIDEDDPMWSESRVYAQPGIIWVKWCVNGMVGWSDPFHMEVME